MLVKVTSSFPVYTLNTMLCFLKGKKCICSCQKVFHPNWFSATSLSRSSPHTFGIIVYKTHLFISAIVHSPATKVTVSDTGLVASTLQVVYEEEWFGYVERCESRVRLDLCSSESEPHLPTNHFRVPQVKLIIANVTPFSKYCYKEY